MGATPTIGRRLALLGAFTAASGLGFAQPSPDSAAHASPSAGAAAVAQPAPEPARRRPVDRTTTHTLTLAGRPLEFQATVATMRLVNAQGAPQVEIVTTAFTRTGVDPAQRPVTFAFNGGPGASSAWLDLGAIGPWRVPIGTEAMAPSRAPVTVDNQETWLDFTDLVFVDPPGTGYSRVVAQGDTASRQVWSVDGDIDTLATAVRRWLEANRRLTSPKYIVGESYGGFRGPKLARTLLDRQGVGVSGLILISPVLDFNGRDARWNPMRNVSLLPSMAAVARSASGRAELREVEEYATGEFLQDLLRGEGDDAAVQRLSTRVAALTGLDPTLVRRRAGRIGLSTFLRDREPGRLDTPYDATISTPDPFPASVNAHAPDPVLDGLRAPLTSAMLDLYATRLDWQPDGAPERVYELLNGQVARQWDFGRGGSRPESYSELREYLALDPHAWVMVAHGLTDLVTPYFGSKLLLDQTPALGPPGRLSLRVYGGGHMFYARDASRAALHEDAASLIGAAPVSAQ